MRAGRRRSSFPWKKEGGPTFSQGKVTWMARVATRAVSVLEPTHGVSSGNDDKMALKINGCVSVLPFPLFHFSTLAVSSLLVTLSRSPPSFTCSYSLYPAPFNRSWFSLTLFIRLQPCPVLFLQPSSTPPSTTPSPFSHSLLWLRSSLSQPSSPIFYNL